MTDETKIETYVVYTANGETYHRTPTCATEADLPPELDCAASAFEKLDIARVGEVGLSKEHYCGNCCDEVVKNL